MDRKVIKVSAAVIMKNNRFLGCCRPENKRFTGLWEFPGGKLEEGETYEQALVREIKEELDADITVESLITECNHDYDDFHLTMRVFKCTLIGDSKPRLNMQEQLGFLWLDEDTSKRVPWVPADKDFLDKIYALLKD